MGRPRNNILPALLSACGLLFSAWCPGAVGWAQEAVPIISARVGRVSRVDGEVWYSRPGQGEKQPLRIGAQLEQDDVVTTGATGRVELTLNPGSSLQIGGGSRVRVHDADEHRMHFDIERGEVFAVIGSLAKEADLVLDTPPALLTIEAKGRYRVRVAETAATEAAVAEGSLSFDDGEGKIVYVTKRRRVRFAASEKRKAWDIVTGQRTIPAPVP